MHNECAQIVISSAYFLDSVPHSGTAGRPGRYEEDIGHPSLAAVNGSERLRVHKLLSQVVCVANVEP